MFKVYGMERGPTSPIHPWKLREVIWDTVCHVNHPSKRNLPEAEKEKIALIDRLQAEGKIKSTGRSPVKLKLFEKSAQDHLYVNSITKRVPVARD